MNKEIRVNFEEYNAFDLIGVITITDGIRSGIRNLLEVGKNCLKGEDFKVCAYLSILDDKSELILDEDVDRDKLDRDHFRDGTPEILDCKFILDEGCEAGRFRFGIDDICIDSSDYAEYLEITSEPVSLKEILE